MFYTDVFTGIFHQALFSQNTRNQMMANCECHFENRTSLFPEVRFHSSVSTYLHLQIQNAWIVHRTVYSRIVGDIKWTATTEEEDSKALFRCLYWSEVGR